MTDSLGFYDGEWLNDFKSGYGTFTFLDGRIYEG